MDFDNLSCDKKDKCGNKKCSKLYVVRGPQGPPGPESEYSLYEEWLTQNQDGTIEEFHQWLRLKNLYTQWLEHNEGGTEEQFNIWVTCIDCGFCILDKDENNAIFVKGITSDFEYIRGSNANDLQRILPNNDLISGVLSTISGGFDNEASGDHSVVSGGASNTASGIDAIVGGGSNNEASGEKSTVSGGYVNKATGTNSVVSGGNNNEASGENSVIAGGASNIAIGENSAISGGASNTASGIDAIVGGGSNNEASGEKSTVSGGYVNKATGTNSVVSGGNNNESSGENSVIAGGISNIAIGENSAISGGLANRVEGTNSVVSGGNGNAVVGNNSVAIGSNNVILTNHNNVVSITGSEILSNNESEYSNALNLHFDNGIRFNTYKRNVVYSRRDQLLDVNHLLSLTDVLPTNLVTPFRSRVFFMSLETLVVAPMNPLTLNTGIRIQGSPGDPPLIYMRRKRQFMLTTHTDHNLNPFHPFNMTYRVTEVGFDGVDQDTRRNAVVWTIPDPEYNHPTNGWIGIPFDFDPSYGVPVATYVPLLNLGLGMPPGGGGVNHDPIYWELQYRVAIHNDTVGAQLPPVIGYRAMPQVSQGPNTLVKSGPASWTFDLTITEV